MTTADPRHHIDVTVEPRYVPEHSQPEPELERYAFSYTVTLHNAGDVTAQLMSRHWVITDGDVKVQEVRGQGVVGEQPVLAPGASHTYTSGCVLPTPVGSMHGSFQMIADDGHPFDAIIKPFRLAKPGALH